MLIVCNMVFNLKLLNRWLCFLLLITEISINDLIFKLFSLYSGLWGVKRLHDSVTAKPYIFLFYMMRHSKKSWVAFQEVVQFFSTGWYVIFAQSKFATLAIFMFNEINQPETTSNANTACILKDQGWESTFQQHSST